MTTLEIQPSDIIKVIGQFLKENGLYRTLDILQHETSVNLNIVESIEQLTNDINSGKWDSVLKTVKLLKISDENLIDLYQHVVLELIELKEAQAATWLLHRTEPMLKLKIGSPDRHSFLLSLVNRPFVDYREVYPDGMTKEKKRATIADCLKRDVQVVPPRRLLSLICDAMRWQKHEGSLPTGSMIDLFTGKTHIARPEQETYPTILHKHCIEPSTFIDKYDNNKSVFAFVCCADFTPDGHYLVVGYSSGLIEVRNSTVGTLAYNLKYQALKNFIVTPKLSSSGLPTAALCLSFNENDIVAIGDKAGNISIWELQTGRLLQVFKSIHEKGVNCVIFSRKKHEIFSGGHDGTVKLLGLGSNVVKRVYKKHTACVNAVAVNKENTHLISGSNDCTVKIWNAQTAVVVANYESQAKVHTVRLLPNFKSDIFMIGDRSNRVTLIDIDAKIRVRLSTDNNDEHRGEHHDLKTAYKKPTNITACCSSPKGDWIYASDSQSIFCFNYSVKKVQHILKMHNETDNACIGVFHHPLMNSLATFDTKGNLKLWRP